MRMVIIAEVEVTTPDASEYDPVEYARAYMDHVRNLVNHSYLVTGQREKFRIESALVQSAHVQEK